MGSMALAGMMEANEMLGLEEDAILSWHLSSNHFPSQFQYLDVAKEALRLAREGEWNATVNVAEIMGDDRCRTDVPVWRLIEAWHLDSFIESEEDY